VSHYILRLLVVLPLLTSCGGGGSNAHNTGSIPNTGVAGDGRLDEILQYTVNEYQLPAMAAIMVHDGLIIEKSAVGLRSSNAANTVSVDDRWHIGSITKSMTSVLAASLVNEGWLSWDTSVADVYPELVGTIPVNHEDIQLSELLTHTAGLSNNLIAISDFEDYFLDSRPLEEQRNELVKKILSLPIDNRQGQFSYSNLGYLVAGAMLERVTLSTWEQLINDYVFAPLLMTNSGFGAPNPYATVSQPIGHRRQTGSWIPINPYESGIPIIPPALISSAGDIHASLDDMAKYLQFHLSGIMGESLLGGVSGKELQVLYNPPLGSNYAMGWLVETSQGITQKLSHDGSNTLWLARVLVDADSRLALFIVTNSADLEENSSSNSLGGINFLQKELELRANYLNGN